jgi:hypothetical protein
MIAIAGSGMRNLVQELDFCHRVVVVNFADNSIFGRMIHAK